MIHNSPPPGYLTVDQVAARLKVSRRSLYDFGLADLADGYQPAANTPILWCAADISKLEWWRFAREALQQLGVNSMSAWPESRSYLDYWYDDAEADTHCPECLAVGVYDPERPERMVCPECGVVEF